MNFRFFYFFIFICFSISADYYEILGVPKTADKATIRKAFKKLSLKYHPDKNKQNPEKAKEKFADIVNAYETLVDPKKRRLYDLQGKPGKNFGNPNQQWKYYDNENTKKEENRNENKKHNKKANDYFDFEEIFSSFWGNFGEWGGNQKKTHQHDDYFHKNQEENEKTEDQDFFSETLVFELNMGSLRYFYNRKEVWLVLFYKSNEKESQNIKTLWINLSVKYNGIFRVAAVNCYKEKEICKNEFHVKNYPSIKGFSESRMSEGVLFEDQALTLETLGNFANFFMKNLVIPIHTVNYESFMIGNKTKFKIIVFSRKKEPSVLLKSLALSFSDSMKFGLIHESEKFLIDKFDIKTIPSLYFITNPIAYEGIKYEDIFNKEKIMIFLRETKKNLSIVPNVKPFLGMVLHLNKLAYDNGICDNENHYLCFVLLTTKISDQQLKVLKLLAENYRKDPIHFLFMKSHDINYEILFPEIKSLPTFIVIKGKTNRYSIIEEFSFKEDKIKDFVDSTLSGNSKFHLINGNLKNTFSVKYKSEL